MSKSIQDITQQIVAPKYAPRTEPKIIPTAAWNEAPLFCLKINDEWLSHVLGALNVLDQSDAWSGTDDEIEAARQQVNEIMLSMMTNCPPQFYSFWASPVPETVGADAEGAIALGVKFHTSIAGNITGLRFYKDIASSGTHTGNLFTTTASVLGTLVFDDETADGWQQANFEEPIAIAACETYVASVHMADGIYSYDRPFFNVPFENPPLYAPASDDIAGGNGVYGYGDATTYPDNTFEQTNYYIDVIFEPTGTDYLG